MTTVSEKVLDVLVIGIYEEYARIYSMITEYEDTAELGPITKEMIIQAHADLQEVILFHQCHITGIRGFLPIPSKRYIKEYLSKLYWFKRYF
ncbi:hypothetical protein NPM18_17655, partial [Bacillus cereus]|nr:hypothetical protein [Bacillus cereus]MCQ6318565.1 hypothetical protein [Bacillus cereus]MCQ6328832.1 hypothetical protein [Bacillus cereus]MCQ6386133.1 hypothetical protein [Bacillus cereus]